MHTHTMIGSHPDVRGDTNDALIGAIDEMLACAQACVTCADACVAEEMVPDLRQCIRLNLDCADLCFAGASLASRRTGSNEVVLKLVLQACAEACRLCGTECRRHSAMHEHCRICAEACASCEDACRSAAASITPGDQRVGLG
jgi:hypothetical protein